MQIAEPEITVQIAEKLGLTSAEFERVKKILGRTPNFTELSIYSVLWSEQFSRKNAIKWLKTLPGEGKHVRREAGMENSAWVDLGDGWICNMLAASQNHPAAIDPRKGASLCTGQLHRKVFATGARPFAALHAFYLGNPGSSHTKEMIREVARGAGDTGNTIGVPVVSAEISFLENVEHHPLVNAFSVGIAKSGETLTPSTGNPGNPVFLVGAQTGRDGFREAALVYAGLPEREASDLSAVPVADPLSGKILMEAVQEVVKTGAVVGICGLDTAGIVGSVAMMCTHSVTGMLIHIDKVPVRQEGMKDWEILISESEGRILLVANAGETDHLSTVFKKWDLECVQIGEVTDTGRITCHLQGEKVADIPAMSFIPGESAPGYDQKTTKPGYFNEISKFNLGKVKRPENLIYAARQLISSPNLASKRDILEQFDSLVGTSNLSFRKPSDAVVLRIKSFKKRLLVTQCGTPSYSFADPATGGMIAVAEAARNIICTGGTPVAVSCCLNLGNPHDPEVYYQFVSIVKGIGDACRKMGVPVINSHVSFFNQTVVNNQIQPVFPTPVVGMLGVMESSSHHTTLDFKEEGDLIYMLGNSFNDLGSAEYVSFVHGIRYSPAPCFDLYEEMEIQSHIRKLIRMNLVRSAHDVARGGLFTCLMESAVCNELGFNIETVDTFRNDCFLFGESQSRIVITLSADKEDQLQNYLINNNVSFTKLGEVFGSDVFIDDKNFGSVSSWKRIFNNE